MTDVISALHEAHLEGASSWPGDYNAYLPHWSAWAQYSALVLIAGPVLPHSVGGTSNSSSNCFPVIHMGDPDRVPVLAPIQSRPLQAPREYRGRWECALPLSLPPLFLSFTVSPK